MLYIFLRHLGIRSSAEVANELCTLAYERSYLGLLAEKIAREVSECSPGFEDNNMQLDLCKARERFPSATLELVDGRTSLFQIQPHSMHALLSVIPC